MRAERLWSDLAAISGQMAFRIMIVLAAVIDLNSYCRGLCASRYQDGFFRGGKCACVDYFSVNLPQRFDVPRRTKKDPIPPAVYDGVDQMHTAPADPSDQPDSIQFNF